MKYIKFNISKAQMTSYEPLAYFHLIKFWNLHNLVTIGAFDILFLSLLAFQFIVV